MKKFSNYVVKTNKNYLELIKYIRDYYTRIFKFGVIPFWKSLSGEMWEDGDAASHDIAKYIYGCQVPETLSSNNVYPADSVNLCSAATLLEGLYRPGAYDGQEYSSAFDIYTLISSVNGGPAPIIKVFDEPFFGEFYRFTQLNTGPEEDDVIIDLNNIIEVSSRVITDRLRYLSGEKLSEIKSAYQYEFNLFKPEDGTAVYQPRITGISSFSVINTTAFKNNIIDYNPGFADGVGFDDGQTLNVISELEPVVPETIITEFDYRTKVTKNFVMGNPLGELVLPNRIIIGKYRVIGETSEVIPVNPIHSSHLYIKQFGDLNSERNDSIITEEVNVGNIIEVKDIIQFSKEPEKYKEMPDILLGNKIIEIDPDCETFNPGCPFKYPSCKFKDNHCFFNLPFAYAESSTKNIQELGAGCNETSVSV